LNVGIRAYLYAVCRMGSYLLVLYLVSKLCYIANVVFQLFVLNKVLGMTYSTFGIDMIKYVCVLSPVSTQSNTRNEHIARVDTSFILAFWRLRQLRPLRTSLASVASKKYAKALRALR